MNEKDKTATTEQLPTTEADEAAKEADGTENAQEEQAAPETASKADPPSDTAPKAAAGAQAVATAEAAPPPAADPVAEQAVPPTAEEQVQKLQHALTKATVETAAAKAGVHPERIGYVVKLVGLDGIDIQAEGSAGKVEAAVGKVLSDLPELIGGAGTGGAGNFARSQASQEDRIRDEVSRALAGV